MVYDSYGFLWFCKSQVPRENLSLTNRQMSDPKTTRYLCATRLEVNEQLIPNGCDVSRQVAATECPDQWSRGVFSVVNPDMIATAVYALWEIEAFEDQAHALQTNTTCVYERAYVHIFSCVRACPCKRECKHASVVRCGFKFQPVCMRACVRACVCLRVRACVC